ncbi:MAG: hypothetical protein COA78_37805 [Blastopirellula sp.]|nr:MAG: hypothetical protein COA78_37805 [Blastopirellula sp.]
MPPSLKVRFQNTFQSELRASITMNTHRRSLSEILANAQLTPLVASSITSDQTYESFVIQDADLKESRNPGICFEYGLFEKANLTACKWMSLEVIKVAFTSCTLSNANWGGAEIEDSEFHRSQLTGFNLAGARIVNTHFSRCKVDLSLFHDAQLKNCRFENCDLREADFQAAKLKQVTFRNCDLRGARFAAATLEDLDFRGSQIAGIHIEPTELSGTKVDAGQVVDFAELLGLVVEGLGEDDPIYSGE